MPDENWSIIAHNPDGTITLLDESGNPYRVIDSMPENIVMKKTARQEYNPAGSPEVFIDREEVCIDFGLPLRAETSLRCLLHKAYPDEHVDGYDIVVARVTLDSFEVNEDGTYLQTFTIKELLWYCDGLTAFKTGEKFVDYYDGRPHTYSDKRDVDDKYSDYTQYDSGIWRDHMLSSKDGVIHINSEYIDKLAMTEPGNDYIVQISKTDSNAAVSLAQVLAPCFTDDITDIPLYRELKDNQLQRDTKYNYSVFIE